MIPGEVRVGDTPLLLNVNLPTTRLSVVNSGDRPIQVGSHFHFAETNQFLLFDRSAAHGRRLNIPAGTSVRFEPGIEQEVELVPIQGDRRVPGLRGLTRGRLDD